jgi:hypothetical protein
MHGVTKINNHEHFSNNKVSDAAEYSIPVNRIFIRGIMPQGGA